MLAARWAKKPALLPYGYGDYILCKDVYHCTPEELYAQDGEIVERHLAFWNGDVQYENAVREAQQQRANGKK